MIMTQIVKEISMPLSRAPHALPTISDSQVIQSKCILVIGNHPRPTPTSHLHYTLNIEPIRSIMHRVTAKFFAHCPSHHNPLVQKIWNYPLVQCFSNTGPRPVSGTWVQLYRAARGSPGICHFSFLSNFHE